MDNTDSEMIESLNILRPPVRRDCNTSLFGYQPNAVNFMSEWRKPKKRVKGGKRIRRSLESSTSLILKRTSDSQIFDRYPVVSYTNTSIHHQQSTPYQVKLDLKQKPLIKVIVVPKDQPSEGKKPERNNLTKKTLNNTDEGKAIETKNVYLVVAGRKKDKVYEIKTTESSTLLASTTELKDEAVNKAVNGDCFKQLFKVLNMEKKKTNNLPVKETGFNHVCKCSDTCKKRNFNKAGPMQEIDTGLSKVKIYGQLGLTEDDRYILKCNATVDDVPVPTTFSTAGQKAFNDFVPSQQIRKRLFREFKVQTDASPPVRTNSPPTKDNFLRKNQPRDVSPPKARQPQRIPVESPTGNDKVPPRNQPRQKMDEYNPENDMTQPRIRNQQRQQNMNEYNPENDMTLRNIQRTQRRMDEYAPRKYTDKKKQNLQLQRKKIECPPGSPLECLEESGGICQSCLINDPQEMENIMDLRPIRQSPSPLRMSLEERLNRCETQATQANINNYSNNDYPLNDYYNNNFVDNTSKYPSTSDKNTQCACDCVDPRLIRGTQSPLVIITVYPNPENDYKTASVSKTVEANIFECLPAGVSETQHRRNPRKSTKSTPIAKAVKGTIIHGDDSRSRAYIRKSYRIPNRSPTPQNNKANTNKVIETRMVKTNLRSQSPSKTPENKSTVRSTIAKINKKQESKKSTTSNQKIAAATNNPRNTQTSKIKSKSRFKDSFNGNQTKPKSLAAEKYKKTIKERVNKYNKTSPKHNVSAVSINIDSENECYDLSFHQGKYTTDMLIRKTIKNNKYRNDSTVNFLPASKKSMLAEFQEPTDNFLDNGVLTEENMSKLKPRDSLELSHRRRTEIETQTEIEQNNVFKDDTRYFAPVKHYTGDDCTISDPFERDREIQQLLGVSRRVISSETTDEQKNMYGYKKFITQQCFGDERECKNILYTNVGFEDSLCSCCCERKSYCRRLNKPPRIIKNRVKKIKQNAAERHQLDKTPIETRASCESADIEDKIVKQKNNSKEKKSTTEKGNVERKEPWIVEPRLEQTSLYQQLILNRNIYIFFQVEQFSKQKTIMLSKEQYDKVKKAIHSTLTNKKYKSVRNRKDIKTNKVDCEGIESLISIGEVRQKTKQKRLKYSETEIQINKKPSFKRSISRSLTQLCSKSWSITKECFQKKKKEQVETVILYSRDIQNLESAEFNIGTCQTMSSLEVGYASIAYLKHVTFSPMDAFQPYFDPLPSESSLALKDSVSIETLFKGHKKCPTPNLGTSTLSISEPSSDSAKFLEKPNQAKRPFLKRLISCLVMRSDKTQMPTLMAPKYAPTMESSFDSYHFSTSLGAIEMSSSLYDTSASFFSNHSVYPKSNKMKRGFLNSMRGFLHNRCN